MKKTAGIILIIVLIIFLAVVGIFIYERAHASFYTGDAGTSISAIEARDVESLVPVFNSLESRENVLV